MTQAAREGEESATVWRQGDRLFHAVSVPMKTGPDLKGVLIAGYGINEALASDIRKLTHSEIAFLTHAPGQPPQLSVSSLGARETALREALGAARAGGGGRAAASPSSSTWAARATSRSRSRCRPSRGETVGRVVALRSLAGRDGRRSGSSATAWCWSSLVVMVLALGAAYLVATRITGPVRRLVGVVERARDGTYSGKVAVDTSDEIGVLARTFNNLLADLREKEQMIGFLREGMTMLKQGLGRHQRGPRHGPHRLDDAAAGRADAGGGVGRSPAATRSWRASARAAWASCTARTTASSTKWWRSRCCARTCSRTTPSLVDRFKQEIKLARRITHRNVLRTHDFGEWNGTPYISMEYLEGVTLKDLIRSKGALPLGVGLRIAKQACQGLEAAHVQGVVHRDIKPQNMLILPETGELKIMDFGIARVSEVQRGDSDPSLTMAGTVMGTPDYMSPEQASGTPADFRSDIYSLGVVLFEMFTGQLPFTGEKVMTVILGHIQKPPPQPRRLNARIPMDLEAIILKCLEKSPKKRYQNVGDVLAALAAVSSEVGRGLTLRRERRRAHGTTGSGGRGPDRSACRSAAARGSAAADSRSRRLTCTAAGSRIASRSVRARAPSPRSSACAAATTRAASARPGAASVSGETGPSVTTVRQAALTGPLRGTASARNPAATTSQAAAAATARRCRRAERALACQAASTAANTAAVVARPISRSAWRGRSERLKPGRSIRGHSPGPSIQRASATMAVGCQRLGDPPIADRKVVVSGRQRRQREHGPAHDRQRRRQAQPARERIDQRRQADRGQGRQRREASGAVRFAAPPVHDRGARIDDQRHRQRGPPAEGACMDRGEPREGSGQKAQREHGRPRHQPVIRAHQERGQRGPGPLHVGGPLRHHQPGVVLDAARRAADTTPRRRTRAPPARDRATGAAPARPSRAGSTRLPAPARPARARPASA